MCVVSNIECWNEKKNVLGCINKVVENVETIVMQNTCTSISDIAVNGNVPDCLEKNKTMKGKYIITSCLTKNIQCLLNAEKYVCHTGHRMTNVNVDVDDGVDNDDRGCRDDTDGGNVIIIIITSDLTWFFATKTVSPRGGGGVGPEPLVERFLFTMTLSSNVSDGKPG